MDKDGAVTIQSNAVTDAKLDKTNIPLSGFGAATADVDLGAKKLIKVAAPTQDQDAATKKYVDDNMGTSNALAQAKVFIGDDQGEKQQKSLSGDITMDKDGAVSIGADKVTTAKILNRSVTTGKIALPSTSPANKVLKVNAAGTGVEWGTIQGDVIMNDAGHLEIVEGAANQILMTNENADGVKWGAITTVSIANSIVTKTGDYTTLMTDDTVLVKPLDGLEKIITLSTAGVLAGKKIIVKKTNETNGTVKVISGQGVTIEGAASIQTNVPYQGWILQFDGANWHIVGHI